MKKNSKIKNKKLGFSLIEILISVSILTIIIGGVVVFGVQAIQSHTKNQAMRNALDNARFAIEGMSKKIRTSSGIVGDASNVFFIDNVDGKKYCYRISGSDLQAVSAHPSDADYSSITSCGSFSVGNFEGLVSGSKVEVAGRFKVKGTDAVLTKKRGFVQISLDITYKTSDAVTEKDTVKIQSGVSLRDY